MKKLFTYTLWQHVIAVLLICSSSLVHADRTGRLTHEQQAHVEDMLLRQQHQQRERMRQSQIPTPSGEKDFREPAPAPRREPAPAMSPTPPSPPMGGAAGDRSQGRFELLQIILQDPFALRLLGPRDVEVLKS